jgi:hypothetical protein
MTHPLELFSNVAGVTGWVFHRGLEIVESGMPETWGADNIRLLCRAVIDGFSGYAASGRQATQCWFEYPEGCVLALTPPLQESQVTRSMARGSDQPQHIAAPFLTFVLADRGVLESVVVPANAFLARQAAIQMDLWLRCRQELLRILGKVMHLSEAKLLLVSTMAAEQLAPQASVAPADFRLLGETLIRQVPDTTLHPQMLEELSAALTAMRAQKAAILTRAV